MTNDTKVDRLERIKKMIIATYREWKESTVMDWIKGFVLNSNKVNEYDRPIKKTRGFNYQDAHGKCI